MPVSKNRRKNGKNKSGKANRFGFHGQVIALSNKNQQPQVGMCLIDAPQTAQEIKNELIKADARAFSLGYEANFVSLDNDEKGYSKSIRDEITRWAKVTEFKVPLNLFIKPES